MCWEDCCLPISWRDDSLGIFLKRAKHSDQTGSVVTRRYNDELLEPGRGPCTASAGGLPDAHRNTLRQCQLETRCAKNETPITCTAGGGSFLIEFGVFLALPTMHRTTLLPRHTSHALWERRSN